MTPNPASTHNPRHPAARWPECPRWCVVAHGEHDGEEDWVHLSEPVRLAKEVDARLVVTVVPGRHGAEDGPYLMIGSEEFTLSEASAFGSAVTLVAEAAKSMTLNPREA